MHKKILFFIGVNFAVRLLLAKFHWLLYGSERYTEYPRISRILCLVYKVQESIKVQTSIDF